MVEINFIGHNAFYLAPLYLLWYEYLVLPKEDGALKKNPHGSG